MNNIVIGLGGTGGKIINKLKHKIYKKDDIPVDYLYIDSNFDLIDRDEHLWRAFGKDISLGANNTYRLTSNHLRGVFDFTHNKVSSRYSNWIGSIENWKDLEVQLQGGYGVVYGNQRRRLGRLFLAEHIDNILNRVNFLVQGLQRKTRSNRNIFHICAGLSGGTGSGTFIDILIQLKKIYQGSNNEFVLYLYLPEDNPHSGKLNGGNYFANAYASLKELNALYTGNWKPWDISRLNKKIDIGSNNSFLATTYLVTNTNGYHSILEVDKMQPEEMIADFISLGLTNNSFHRSLFGIENSFTRDEYKNAQPLRSRNFHSFGIKRIIYPKDEIFEYMNYKVLYHLMLSLYNPKDYKKRYKEVEKKYSKIVSSRNFLQNLKLRPEYLLLSIGILDGEQRWKSFENDWVEYIELYTLISIERKGLKHKEIINNLVLDCEKQYNSRYRNLGVKEFFNKAYNEAPNRVTYLSAHIQNFLLSSWLRGDMSSSEIEFILDEIIEYLNQQEDSFKKKNDELGIKILQSRKEIDFWRAKLEKEFFFTKKAYTQTLSALEEFYIYKTYYEAYNYSEYFLNMLINTVKNDKKIYINLMTNIKKTSNNLEVNYNVQLQNDNDSIEKIYDKKSIDSLLNTMILKNKDIMDSFKNSTKNLIEGKQDFISLSKLFESRNFIFDMELTIDNKLHNILEHIANTQPKNDILNKNILNELGKKYSNNQKELDMYMNTLLNESKFYLPFDNQELNNIVDNTSVVAYNQSVNYILYPNDSTKKDFLRFSMKANQNSQPRNDGLNNELTIINIQPSFPLRYIAKLKRLAHNYEVRYESNKQGDMDIQLHIEGSKDDYPDLFIEDISYPKEKSILDEDNIFNENFISELVLDDEQIEVIDFEGKVVDVFSSKVDIMKNTSVSKSLVYDVFISHHSHDTEIATQLYNYLKDKRLKVFLPRISMKSGEEWVDKMNNALRNSKVFIAIGSKKEYMESPWVKKERTVFEVLRQVDTSKALYSYIVPPMTISELPNELMKVECFNGGKSNELERLYSFISYHLYQKIPKLS